MRGRLAGEPDEKPVDAIVQVNATARTTGGRLSPGKVNLEIGARTVRFEIPADYQALKAADPALAFEWRLAIREICEAYFAAGYVLMDFIYRRTPEGGRSYYILEAG